MCEVITAMMQQPSYRLFRQAIAEKKAPLTIICGSGLSMSAGLPNWAGLRAVIEHEADAKERAVNQIGKYFISPKLKTAKDHSDPWVAFKLLREILGRPVFENIVERELSPSEDATLPSGYRDLMRLSPAGIVTLNLDKFAGEAVAQSHPGALVTPIYGTQLAARWNELRAARTFLVYLHGAIHDPSSWVMTQDELEILLKNEGHRHFIETVINDNLVLFVGMSADDIALSKRLLDARSAGFQPRNLYWLTPRPDDAAERWANDANVSLIRYQVATKASHDDVIKALVDDCTSFLSKDAPEPPLENSSAALKIDQSTLVRDPEDLAQELPEKIRYTISALLDESLSRATNDDAAFAAYRDFCERYDYAVDRSFYRSNKDKFKKWFGYELQGGALGRGNFGEVYSATDKNGELVAVKIMHKNIFGNDEMLGGFRRGVRSMQIVTDSAVPGMVPIIDSFELPPTIIMPYVGGVSLEDAIRHRPDMPWLTKLAVAVKIGQVVGGGHALPQTVLHRDLKPSNIMITNMEWSGAFDPDIVVLDFDMSWHKGSKEKDVVFESRDDFGYLAPEQTDATNRYAARSTRVDSYGFGMTIFFLFGMSPPRPNEALSDQWLRRATRAALEGYDQTWQSAPHRLGRLISRATQIDQNARIDFSGMTHELEFINQAVSKPGSLVNPELWAEEVISSVSTTLGYVWDDATGSGEFELPSGITVRSRANFRNSTVEFSLKYIEKGLNDRSSVGRYLSSSAAIAVKNLSDSGWKIDERRASSSEASIEASIPVFLLRESYADRLSAAARAVEAFQF